MSKEVRAPYRLPESERERLNRTEMNSIRWCLAGVNNAAISQEELSHRLECIPNGKVRFRLMLAQYTSILKDIFGTIPKKQRDTIEHTLDDMEIRMVPKLTPKSGRVSMGVDDLTFIVDVAKRDICTACTYTDDECRKCKLYQILESISPLTDWGPSTMCPYNRPDWWDR